jgi:hypothetical protein
MVVLLADLAAGQILEDEHGPVVIQTDDDDEGSQTGHLGSVLLRTLERTLNSADAGFQVPA